MSNIFNQYQGRTAATTQPQAMGIDLQGAQYGPPIPVVYGQNRVGGNVIWYGDFKAVQHTQKVGKGFGGGTATSYTYSASYLNGLCEGPIVGIANVWSGNSLVLLSTLAPFSATGTSGQAPWSALPSPANLGYSLTALFGVDNMALGGSPTLPNYNYEIGGLQQFGSGVLDANPSAILTDICTDPNHGVPFPYLGNLTQYSDYCVANGLFLSPVYDQQSTAVQVLTDLFKNTNTYAYWSEGQLKVVPLGDVAVTGNGVTYTPNVTPLVNLGAGDFIVSGHASPVTVQRKAPVDCFNSVSIQFVDRANAYHNSAQIASIDEDMIANGARMTQTANVNGCVTAPVARFIAQNMVQRAYYVRNQYKFKLTWRYCYLEPTDIVTLTDTNTGLNEFPVRILEVAEDADGLLDITAEEFPEGIGHSALYNTQPNNGTNLDPMADPGPVNAPFFMRAPGFLVSNNKPEIWCAVGGSNPIWGACEIYMSRDGSTYEYLGTTNKSARYGTLTSALNVGSDPDTVNTLAVQLYTPSIIMGATDADANNLDTLCIVDSEVVSYGSSTLTNATPDSNYYNLTYLRRGAYASGIASHAIGAPFARIDDSIFRVPIDPSIIGQTLYFKFLSLNAFGITPRTLADETAYTYVVGTNVELPDVPFTPQNFSVKVVTQGAYLSWTNPIPSAVGATSIERAPDASGSPGTFAVIGAAGPTANTFTDITGNGTFWYRIRSRGPLLSSGWSGYTVDVSADNGTYANVSSGGVNSGGLAYNFLGAWSAIVAYVQGNEVNYAGNYWLALAPSTNSPPTSTNANWQLLGPQTLDNLADGEVFVRLTNSVAVAEMLDNPDFEASTALPPPGWSAGGPGATAPSSTSYLTGGSQYSGNQSLQFTGPQSAGYTANRTFLTKENDRWVLYAATNNLSAVGQSAIASVHFLDVNGNILGEGYVTNTAAASGWYVGSVVAQAPANTVGMALQVKNGAAGTNSVGFDAIRLVKQITDQRSLPQIAVTNYRSKYNGPSPGYSSTTTSATISVGAFSYVIGSITVNYNASSVTVTGTAGTTVTYFLYFDDPTYAGGTPALVATTNGMDCYVADGRVFLGSISVTFPSSGTGSGSGSGGGGWCVGADMYVRPGQRAADVASGDLFDCADWPTSGNARFERPLHSMERAVSECVVLVADDGSELVCSVTTPFDLLDGGAARAPEMLGQRVLTDAGIATIVRIDPVGVRDVCRMHFGGISFAAGVRADRRIYSHNTTTAKP